MITHDHRQLGSINALRMASTNFMVACGGLSLTRAMQNGGSKVHRANLILCTLFSQIVITAMVRPNEASSSAAGRAEDR